MTTVLAESTLDDAGAALAGYHLFIDGLGDAEKWTPELAKTLMLALVALADMTVIYGPKAKYSGQDVVGMTIIAESHISVHLKRDAGAAFIDLFSCKPFDKERAVETVVLGLALSNHCVRFMER